MRATTPNRTLSQLLIYFFILTAPYTAWHFLRLTFRTSSPLVFVTSESMSPVYQRGDILFVSNRTPAIELGDVVVCWFEGRKLPFVHRVIEKHVLPARVARNQRYDEIERDYTTLPPFTCEESDGLSWNNLVLKYKWTKGTDS